MKQKFHFIKKRNTKRLYHWKLTNMWKHWCLLQVKSSTQLMKLGRSQKTKRKALINGTDKRGIKDSWFCSDDWLCPTTRQQFASSKQGIQGKLYDWASRIASCNSDCHHHKPDAAKLMSWIRHDHLETPLKDWSQQQYGLPIILPTRSHITSFQQTC